MDSCSSPRRILSVSWLGSLHGRILMDHPRNPLAVSLAASLVRPARLRWQGHSRWVWRDPTASGLLGLLTRDLRGCDFVASDLRDPDLTMPSITGQQGRLMDIDLLEQLIAPGDGINSSIRPLPDLARRPTYVQRVVLRCGICFVCPQHRSPLAQHGLSNPNAHPFRHPRLQAQVHVRTEIP